MYTRELSIAVRVVSFLPIVMNLRRNTHIQKNLFGKQTSLFAERFVIGRNIVPATTNAAMMAGCNRCCSSGSRPSTGYDNGGCFA